MNIEREFPQEIKDKARILVVEDNHLNQKLDAFLLDSWGLRHHICDNGVTAISQLNSSAWDLILMDIRLPELDGYEATRLIREELKLDIPIIGITAYSTAEEKERCLAVGMNNYIIKPVNEYELRELLMQYLVPAVVEGALHQ